MPCRFACEVRNFQAERWLDTKKAKRFDRSILYAIAAGKQAMGDAGFVPERVNADRFGIVEGTTVSGLDNTLHEHRRFVAKGYRSVQPSLLVNAFCGGASSEMAIELGLQCQATTITTGCSAGNDAIGHALRTIQDDVADVMLTGATEAPIVDGFFSVFAAAGVMSRKKDNPATAMRPFDRDHDGFVLGEGSAFLVLEELAHARARGARIYCEIIGHGQACDAHNSVALCPDASGAKRSIERALFQGHVSGDAIDYINAHGSATGMNDALETKGIRETFGARAKRIPVSATKPVTGHLIGGSAAVEALVCALALHHSIVPPTANFERAAAGCDLDYVGGGARDYPLKVVMSLSAGFGGKHSAVIMRKV
jgi:3-oxoacyl-[acyl-carrier-protein] synthase II